MKCRRDLVSECLIKLPRRPGSLFAMTERGPAALPVFFHFFHSLHCPHCRAAAHLPTSLTSLTFLTSFTSFTSFTAAKPQEVLDNQYNCSYTNSMKTAISIPDKIFRSADALAKRLGVSRSELYATAVNEFLSKHRSRHVTARLDEVYSEEDSSMPSSLTQMQARSLPHEDW